MTSWTCLMIPLDILTIYSPSITREFDKYIPDIYPAELQLNRGSNSDKEMSFFDLNIKVIGSDIHTSVYDKRDDFGFPIVNFPWLSGDVLRLPSYGIYILHLVRFARCCTSVLDFHSKNLQITSKLLTQGYRYHKLRKHLASSLDHTPNFYRNLVIFCFKNMTLCLRESLTRSSTVIYFTNYGRPKTHRISSRRVRK